VADLKQYTPEQLEIINQSFAEDRLGEDDALNAVGVGGTKFEMYLENGQRVLVGLEADETTPGSIKSIGVTFRDSEGDVETAHLNVATGVVSVGEKLPDLKDANLEGAQGSLSRVWFQNAVPTSLDALNAERKFSEARQIIEASAESLDVKIGSIKDFKMPDSIFSATPEDIGMMKVGDLSSGQQAEMRSDLQGIDKMMEEQQTVKAKPLMPG
jgi:hypothetical protein